jgi:hypothetical protein
VAAVSSNGTPFWSTTARDFNVTTPAALPAPNISSPSGQILTDRPQFTWSTVAGAARYHVWVSNLTTGQSPALQNPNATSSPWQPAVSEALVPGHRYRWWVAAVSSNGTPSWSTSLDFNIPALTRPTASGPSGSTNNTTPQFTWSAVTAADHYEVWLQNLTTGENPVQNPRVTTNSWTPTTPLVRTNSYRWWVRALSSNEATASLWSLPLDFLVTAT